MSLQMYLTRRHKYCNVAEIWYLNTSHWSRKLPGFIQPWHFQFQTNPAAGEKKNTIIPNGDVGRNQILPWCWNISTLWGAKSQWNLSTCDREILRTILWQWIDVSRDWLDGNTWEQLTCCFNCWSGWDGLKYCSAGAQNTEIQEWWYKKYTWQQQQFQRKGGFMMLKRFLASLKLNTSRCFRLQPSHLQSPSLWEFWRRAARWRVKTNSNLFCIGNSFPGVG